MCNTIMNLLTANQDPRTFVYATPAKFQIENNGLLVSNFAAYNGLNIDSSYSSLVGNSNNCSYSNYSRYYTITTGAGPATGDESKGSIVIGYPEQCFNLAEAYNQVWIAGGSAMASKYYNDGIMASLSYFGVAQGGTINILDEGGVAYVVNKTPLTTAQSTVTFNVTAFLANVALSANTDTAYSQILNQKYVAFWNNSGWEAFYNWRRTSSLNASPTVSAGGYPTTFTSTDPLGVFNGTQKIPRRWQYPTSEATYNTANWQAAINAQYGGKDDLFQDVWINQPASATPK
jgi:hypothetical protein